jgi:hypothetical protein
LLFDLKKVKYDIVAMEEGVKAVITNVEYSPEMD